jgi:NADPH:quinone reductase-like Zn-dependent oxidoreductase
MLYEFEEPFVVDHSKFEQAFGEHATPLGEAIGDTVRWLPRQASDRGYSSSCLESGLSEKLIYIVREKRIEIGIRMKAMVYTKYGPPDILDLTEVEKPTPKDDEVLLKVHAASVNPADWHLLRGKPYIARLQSTLGLRKPKDRVLGCDVAGQVEAVGKDVTMLRLGDDVFGSPFMHGFGAFAECVCVSEDLLAPKPATLSFEQAASIPLAASTALQGLRDHGRIEPGQKVLVIGASGGVGTFAVQIAKSFDAEVTGVCSTRNVEMVRSIGADHVIDYTKEDFTQSGQKYDLIFQVAGTRSPSECRRALTSKGTLVQISGESDGRWIGAVDRIIKALVLSPFVSQKMASFTVKPNKEDLRFLKQLIESGKLAPVIDRTYPLSETPEAIRYLESGHARGKVVITVPGQGA